MRVKPKGERMSLAKTTFGRARAALTFMPADRYANAGLATISEAKTKKKYMLSASLKAR